MQLNNIPFFDNHTHTLDYTAEKVDCDQCIGLLLHGLREHIDRSKGFPCMIEASAEQKQHIRKLGSVRVLEHRLAEYFQCEEDLDVIFRKRNEAAAAGQYQYAEQLYQDANIKWCMLDSELPLGDEKTKFPCRVLRLYQMDGLFDKMLKECDSYDTFLDAMLNEIRKSINDGFTGVKCHVGERFTLAVREVDPKEARTAYKAARAGVYADMETVYFAVFAKILLLCSELDVTIHIHTGSSGDPADGNFAKLDPLLLAPFLINEAYLKTKIVLLHGSYPNTKNAALMAHAFPNVYVDYSWVVPWTSCGFDNTLKDAIELAPHSKIIIGTGQHGIPEIAWLAAKVLRASLSRVLDDLIRMDLVSESQALDIAEMILSGNARRLYKLD